MFRRLALALGIAAATLAPPATAADELPDGPMTLVAAPELADPVYHHSVLIAVPIKNDQHIGLIVNRPTNQTLGTLFPEHEASRRVSAPVYFGGPMAVGTMFALVRSDQAEGPGAIEVLKNLHIVTHVDAIDRIIETRPNDAKYYAGVVLWRPGELRAELENGLWKVQSPDADVIFRPNVRNLWSELATRARTVTAKPDPLAPPAPHDVPRFGMQSLRLAALSAPQR